MNIQTPIYAETLVQLTESEWTRNLDIRAERTTIARVERVGENLRDSDGAYTAYRLVDTKTGKVFVKGTRKESCCWYDEDDDYVSSADKSKKLIIVRSGEALQAHHLLNHLHYDVQVKVLGRPGDFAELMVAKIDADKKADKAREAVFAIGNAFHTLGWGMPTSGSVVELFN